MPQIHYLKLFKRKWDVLFLFTGTALILSLILTFVQPLRYGAEVRVLIIQRTTLTLDTFSALKSAERVADNLTQVVYTTNFFNQVLAKNSRINQNYFKKDENKRRKQWRKMVRARITRGTGLLTVTVYHKDRNQAIQIASGVADVLTQSGWEYVGGGDIQVRVVDTPLLSRYPVKPNIPFNIIMGIVIGFLVGVFYILYTSRIHLFSGHKE